VNGRFSSRLVGGWRCDAAQLSDKQLKLLQLINVMHIDTWYTGTVPHYLGMVSKALYNTWYDCNKLAVYTMTLYATYALQNNQLRIYLRVVTYCTLCKLPPKILKYWLWVWVV